jgi:predicted RNA-binding protein associated with RNAse of E/G family
MMSSYTSLKKSSWASRKLPRALRCKVLDEEKLENALQNGWITKQLYDRAEKEMKKLVSIVKRGKFPSCYVISLEEKLFL